MGKEGFLRERRAKGREISCQFRNLDTIQLVAMTSEIRIQETKSYVVVLLITLCMSPAIYQEKRN